MSRIYYVEIDLFVFYVEAEPDISLVGEFYCIGNKICDNLCNPVWSLCNISPGRLFSKMSSTPFLHGFCVLQIYPDIKRLGRKACL